MRAAGREETIFASLSRALCGTLGRSLILNLPGSPRAAVTSLTAVLPLVAHTLTLISGEDAPHRVAGKNLKKAHHDLKQLIALFLKFSTWLVAVLKPLGFWGRGRDCSARFEHHPGADGPDHLRVRLGGTAATSFSTA